MPESRCWRYRENGIEPSPRRVRGFLEPCILFLLSEDDSHGYNLVEGLKRFGFDRTPVDPSVIYRTLRRLEAGDLTSSSWDTDSSAGPPRRVYHLTEQGRFWLATWAKDLAETERVLRCFLESYNRRVEKEEERG